MATLARGLDVPHVIAVPRRALRFKGYLLVLPAVIYVLALLGFPLVLGIWYSLTDVTLAREGRFIGLKHFVDAWDAPCCARCSCCPGRSPSRSARSPGSGCSTPNSAW